MKNKLFIKGLVFGIIILFMGTSIGTGLQIQTKITNERGSLPTTGIIWSENFDNGNISNWTIINPNPGYQPITLGLSTIQSYSSPYSLLVDSPDENYYSGYALGPMVSVDLTKPYTIEFWFRWNDFHYGYFCCFGHIDAVLDQPFLGIDFKDDTGEHVNTGPAFNSYCLVNTWTHFQFNINPATSSFTMIVNGNTILTFNYTLSIPGTSQFGIIDGGAPYPEPDFFDQCYWDDMRIEGTQIPIFITISLPQENSWNHNDVTISGMAQSTMGTIINVSIQIDNKLSKYATINGILWNYVWETKKEEVIDGPHTIVAYCIDSAGNNGHSFPMDYTCYLDNTPPNITLGYPQAGIPCTFGRSWLALYHFIPSMRPIKLITGAVNFIPSITEFGSGMEYVEFELFDERLNDVVGEHTDDEYPFTWYCDVKVFGIATLTIRAPDKEGNIGVYTYSFLKLF